MILSFFKPISSAKMMIGAFVALCMLMFLFNSSCKHKPVIPDTPAISFSKDVDPIIQNNCALSGCHDSNSRKSLTSYNDVMNYVTSGNADKSQLFKSITALNNFGGNKPMPPDQPLSEEQLKLIYAWIMQGAQNN